MSSSAVPKGEPAISVHGLSKAYRLGVDSGATTIREALLQTVKGGPRKEGETLWALKDVGFDVARG